MSWKCPHCGSKNLVVNVMVSARLYQEDDNFETEAEGDHEWDDDNYMMCLDCDFKSCAADFDEELKHD